MTPDAETNIRAMVVGTSNVVADRVKAVLKASPDINLAAEARDGIDAVSKLRRAPLDVIFIDIGDRSVKPGTDLSRLLKVDPEAKIILVATLTFANVKNAMACLVKGAAEFIQTPSQHTRHLRDDDFERQVHELAIVLGKARRQKGERKISPPPVRHEHPVPTDLRPRRLFIPKAIAIASSTGGPQALLRMFDDLPHSIQQPVFLTQHMPAGFTQALAGHIEKRAGWSCAEGIDGEKVTKARAYLAPGDYHMTVENRPDGPIIKTNQGPPENYCRPSAEPMMRSLIKVYGAENILYVVLTGMGSDGKAGAATVADGGGTVVIQDKESSVVWGMPGAIANAGSCHAMLPIDEIGVFVAQAARGQ